MLVYQRVSHSFGMLWDVLGCFGGIPVRPSFRWSVAGKPWKPNCKLSIYRDEVERNWVVHDLWWHHLEVSQGYAEIRNWKAYVFKLNKPNLWWTLKHDLFYELLWCFHSVSSLEGYQAEMTHSQSQHHGIILNDVTRGPAIKRCHGSSCARTLAQHVIFQGQRRECDWAEGLVTQSMILYKYTYFMLNLYILYIYYIIYISIYISIRVYIYIYVYIYVYI